MPTLTELLGVAGSIPYWVNGTNYAQGKTVRSPTDHQLYVRIIAGGGATDPANDTTNWRPDGGRPIKSIQRGTVTVANGGISGSVTISSVNTAKAELRLLGGTAQDQGTGNYFATPKISLTNSTTVSASFGANTNYGQISWELTEYY